VAKNKDLELALRIRADLKQAQASLKQLEGTLGLTGSAARKAGAGLSETGRAAGRVRNEIGQLPAMLTRLAGLFAAAFSAREVAQAAEAYTQIRNRLALVTDSTESLAQAQDAVFQIAQNSRQPLDATAELYQRIATNADALNLSASGVAGVVDTINKSLAISGTSGQAAEAALVQLGQAFASGTLCGEELNSVLEQAPALAKTLADGLGVPVGKLRELGETGKLSAQNVIQALESQAAAVDQQFSKIQVTGGQAMTALGNSLTRVIGELDQASGASAAFGETILDISQWLDSGQLTDGLLDSMAIWGGVFEAIGADIQSLNLDLDGLADSGSASAQFLAQAFKEMPANLRSAIQLATVEILALFDKAVAYAQYAGKAIEAAFTDATEEAAAQQLEQRIQQINEVRGESVATILEERDAILEGAAADRQRRDEQRKSLEEARAQRQKDIEQLREQAKARGVTLPTAAAGGSDKKAKDVEKYVRQLERQAATLGMSAAEVRAYELAEKGLTGAMQARAAVALELINQEERKRLADADGKQLSGMQAQLLSSQGQQAAAAAIQIEQQYGELVKRLQDRGDAAGLDLVNRFINVEQARAQLEELQAEVDRVFADQGRREQTINTQQQAGLLSEIGAREEILDLNQATSAQIEQLLPKMRELAAVTGDPAAIERLKDLESRLGTLTVEADQFSRSLKAGFETGIQSALQGLATGTMNLREAALSFINSIASSMATMASQELAKMATSGLAGLLGGGQDDANMTAGAAAVTASAGALSVAGSTLVTGAAAIEAAAATLAAANGGGVGGSVVNAGSSSGGSGWLGLITKAASAYFGGGAGGGYTGAYGFAEGGHVRGPGTSTSDSIFAKLSDQEYVVRASVVTQQGMLPLLHDLNARGFAALDDWYGARLAHHSTGGLAGVPAPAMPSPGLGGNRLADPAKSMSATLNNAINLHVYDDPQRIADSAFNSRAGQENFVLMLSRDPARYRSILGIS